MNLVRRAGSAGVGATRTLLCDPALLAASVIGAIAVGLVLGIPTDIVPNPWFTRMTPVYTDQYVWWVATSLLTGALLATYLIPRGGRIRSPVGGVGGGLLGYLAIGCPVCNKLVVGLIGFSGALNYFAPIQPFLGAGSVILAGFALMLRLSSIDVSCRVPDANPAS